jgi:EcsC protein family
MGVTSKAAGAMSKQLAPRIGELAPGLTTSFVREALHRAIVGVGPLPPASKAADAQLREQKGDVEKAVHEVIENHVRYAAAQGFVTNLGGLVTIAITIPTNITGLALIQCRMIAGIAHLRGYDLADPKVKNAILVCLLGEEVVDRQVKAKKVPAPPMALATSPGYDAATDQDVAAVVAADLLAKVAGKRLAVTVSRRIPVLGGVVGMSVDGYTTWQIGRYADRELLPLARR